MPTLNTVESEWDLLKLVEIHGLVSGEDPEYAIEGIAVDLDVSVEAVKAMLVAANINW